VIRAVLICPECLEEGKLIFPQDMENQMDEKKDKLKMQKTTVAEARHQLAAAKDDDTFVWGTNAQEGNKKEFAAQLSRLADGDALVWGT
jgi:hypothetical protein